MGDPDPHVHTGGRAGRGADSGVSKTRLGDLTPSSDQYPESRPVPINAASALGAAHSLDLGRFFDNDTGASVGDRSIVEEDTNNAVLGINAVHVCSANSFGVISPRVVRCLPSSTQHCCIYCT